MKEERKIFKLKAGKSNFLETKLESICGKDDLRPAMQCVYFSNGFVYATNAHIAVKQRLTLHGIDEDLHSHLEGKLLHRSHLALMRGCDFFEIVPNGIKSRKGFVEMIHVFTDEKYPDIEAVLNKDCPIEVSRIALNASLLKNLQDVMFLNSPPNHVRLDFFGTKRAIIAFTDIVKEDQIGLIMPTQIKEDEI